MKIKKFLAVAAVCAALAGLLAVSASAHGGHHHRRSAQTYYPACPVEDCVQAGAHLHDGVTYCGHANGGCGGYGHHGIHC